jgi:hypothetical protein
LINRFNFTEETLKCAFRFGLSELSSQSESSRSILVRQSVRRQSG